MKAKRFFYYIYTEYIAWGGWLRCVELDNRASGSTQPPAKRRVTRNLHRQLRFPPALAFKRLLLAVLRQRSQPQHRFEAALSVCPVMSARAAAAAADAEKKAAALAAAAKQAAIAAAAEEQARELKAKIDAAAGVIAPLAQHF